VKKEDVLPKCTHDFRNHVDEHDSFNSKLFIEEDAL